MNGVNHSLVGGVIGASAISIMGHTNPTKIIPFTLLTMGCAYLPDLDHKEATLAHKIPFGKFICKRINKLANGHRHKTHTIFFAFFCAFLSWLSTFYKYKINLHLFGFNITEIRLVSAVFISYLTFIVLNSIKIKISLLINFSISIYVGLFCSVNKKFFIFGVFLSIIAHLIGDVVTTQGLPGGKFLIYQILPLEKFLHTYRQKDKKFIKKNGFFMIDICGSVGSPSGQKKQTTVAVISFLITLGLILTPIIQPFLNDISKNTPVKEKTKTIKKLKNNN